MQFAAVQDHDMNGLVSTFNAGMLLIDIKKCGKTFNPKSTRS